MKQKTWAEYKAEMKQADRKEWLYIIAFSSTVVALLVFTITVFGQ